MVLKLKKFEVNEFHVSCVLLFAFALRREITSIVGHEGYLAFLILTSKKKTQKKQEKETLTVLGGLLLYLKCWRGFLSLCGNNLLSAGSVKYLIVV